MIDTVITNAKVVTPTDIVLGSIAIDRGRIELWLPSSSCPRVAK